MIEYIITVQIIVHHLKVKEEVISLVIIPIHTHKTLQTNYFVHLKALHLVSSCALITSIQMEQPELLIHAYSLPKVIK